MGELDYFFCCHPDDFAELGPSKCEWSSEFRHRQHRVATPRQELNVLSDSTEFIRDAFVGYAVHSKRGDAIQGTSIFIDDIVKFSLIFCANEVYSA